MQNEIQITIKFSTFLHSNHKLIAVQPFNKRLGKSLISPEKEKRHTKNSSHLAL
jgi:hypothetical protein